MIRSYRPFIGRSCMPPYLTPILNFAQSPNTLVETIISYITFHP